MSNLSIEHVELGFEDDLVGKHDLTRIAWTFVVHHGDQQVRANVLETGREVDDKVSCVELRDKSMKQVVVPQAVVERERRVCLENEFEVRVDGDLVASNLNELAIRIRVVGEIAFNENLDETILKRESLGVLEEHGQTVRGRVDELVVELIVRRVQYAQVVLGQYVQIGLDGRKVDGRLEFDHVEYVLARSRAIHGRCGLRARIERRRFPNASRACACACHVVC